MEHLGTLIQPMANLGFLSIDIGTILFTLINTGILLFGMKKLLFDRVNNMLEKRQNAISADYDKANQAREDAEKLKNDYSALMQNSKDEAANIVKDAAAKATRRSDEILLQAKNDANAIREKANVDIEWERKLAKSQLRDEISELAVEVASKIVEKEVKKDEHDKLITEFLETVGEV